MTPDVERSNMRMASSSGASGARRSRAALSCASIWQVLPDGRIWRRRALTLTLALFILAWTVSTAAAQCGEDYHAAPVHSDLHGARPPLAIGDSVLADAVPLLAREGFEADGMVCRQMSQGLTLLRARALALPHLVVLALGTNGEVTTAQIDTALSILGPRRILALVTPHGGVAPSSPGVIRAAAASHPGQIVLLDWDRLVSGHAGWLAPDGVHLGGAAGIAAFARMVGSVLGDATSESPGASPPTATEAEGVTDPGTPTTIQPPPGHRDAASTRPSAVEVDRWLSGLAVLVRSVAAAAGDTW